MDRPSPQEVTAFWKRPARLIRAQLSVSVDEGPEKAAASMRNFFSDAWIELGEPFRTRFRNSPDEVLDGDARARSGPGAISAMVGVRSDGIVRKRRYSEKVWSDFIGGLDEVPSFTWFDILSNGEDGWSNGPGFGVHCRRIENGGTWAIMQIWGEKELTEGAQRKRLIRFLETQAMRCNPVYGEISWNWDLDSTVLELALNLQPTSTLPDARAVLRGYAWITIVPEEVGRRLGGEAGLKDTGSFWGVRRLPGGGYFLQATKTLEAYDEPAAEAVCRALLPALPPGRPDFWNVHAPNVLADLDPATFGRR